MTSFHQALQIILSTIEPVETENTPLRSLHGRVLAQDVIAPIDVPPFDNAGMDGYAIRSVDTAGARSDRPVLLSVTAEVAAGEQAAASLQKGSAFRILTGAPVPSGSDAVVEQERVELANGEIRITEPILAGRNVRSKGEDVSRGTGVLRRGSLLDAARVGVVASLGSTELTVFKIPRVAVLSTGNELVDAGLPLKNGQIHDSNSYTLQGLVRETGCDAVAIGPASDSKEDLEKRIKTGLTSDALITAGGVSVGTKDLVLQALRESGVEILFWKVNIKPGMPFAFGIHRSSSTSHGVPVFALPGNPVSAMVTFLQLVRPALRSLMGAVGGGAATTLKAKLEHDYIKKDEKLHFARGIVRNENGTLVVRTTGIQSSGVLTSLSAGNCLIVIPQPAGVVAAGSEVEVQLTREVATA
jgi:molybdopterin molybdotransferase